MKQGFQSSVAKKIDQAEGQTGKQQRNAKSWQEGHAEILKNIQSTNIGKPTQVEAQRILKIMESLYTNLTIYAYLDTDFISKFQDLQKGKLPKDLVNQLSVVGKDLLVHQAELEAKFKPYAYLLDVNQKGEEPEIEEDKKVLAEQVYKQVETNFKNLLRYMKDHSNDFGIIKSMKPNLNSEISDLVHCIECQRVIYQKKLSTAHEEEESHKKQLQELNKKIEGLQKKKDSIDKNLKKMKTERDQFSKDKKEELEKLRNEISLVRGEKKKKRELLLKEKEIKMKQLDKDHDDVKQDLDRKIAELTKQFIELKEKNQKTESGLKLKKQAQQNYLEENLKTYDNTMEDKMAEMHELQDELDKISKELAHLEDHFSKIDQEKKREQDLKKEHQIRIDQYELERKRKQEAIKRIEMAFKLYKENSKKKKKRKGKAKAKK